MLGRRGVDVQRKGPLYLASINVRASWLNAKISTNYGHARVSKSDSWATNLQPSRRSLTRNCILKDLIIGRSGQPPHLP